MLFYFDECDNIVVNNEESGCFAVSGEKGNFKGRVFGGFNRHDVIDYIETLATERNELSRENERLRGQVEALEERLEEASQPAPGPEAQPEDDGRQELLKALEQAEQILRDVKREYDNVCADLKINVSQADHEMKQISAKLSGLQSSLDAAGERLEAVSAQLEEKRDAQGGTL